MNAYGGLQLSPRILGAVAAVFVLVLVLLYFAGWIGGHKVAPGTTAALAPRIPGQEYIATERDVADIVDWPGVVRARLVANVAPRVMARIAAVPVVMGNAVQTGDPLVVLDDRDLHAKREQARAQVAAAEAEADHAGQEERRARALYEQRAATQQDVDAAVARARAARAALQRARDVLAEAEVGLGETVLRAPFAGIVAARLADPGDLAVPGQPVVIVHDPASLRFEAAVGEACSEGLVADATFPVQLDAPAKELLAQLREVSPQADAVTRTVRIKLDLPPAGDIRPGAYGVVRVPCGRHRALLVPAGAVSRRGQLEFVYVVSAAGTELRHVRCGKRHGEQIEILSGLAPGERVLVPAPHLR